MPSLLEAIAAIGIGAAVLALISASIVGQSRVQTQCDAVAAEMFTDRQLEQLVDRAAALAGAGPTKPQPISSIDSSDVVFASDQNGDGVVSTSGSETTALEVRQSAGQAQVRIRLGKQTMTVVNADGSDAVLAAYDRYGTAASAAAASWVELDIRPRNSTDTGSSPRTLLFSVPARTIP